MAVENNVGKVKQQRAGNNLDWRRYLRPPEPVPSMWAYKLERWKALGSSPRRLINYLNYKHSVRRSALANYLPIKLDIENVSRCNFHCTMCQVSEWVRYQRALDMSFEDFKRLIDEQWGLVEIKLQGMGEPTLGGETFFRMIRYARSKHIWVRTVTNASLLHINDNYKKLIDSGVNELQISIDGATKATFERIRRGSCFEKVVENCKRINAYCRERGIKRTKMWVVVQRDNVQEVLLLLELAHEMGFKSLVYSMNLSDWGQEKWNAANREATVEDRVSRETVASIMERAAELGIRVGWWNITAKYQTGNVKYLCPWPFERAYVSSDLRIVPCCMIANPDVIELGNGRHFASAWNDKTYQDFRRAHLDGRVPKVCENCYVSPQRDSTQETVTSVENYAVSGNARE